MSKQYGLILPGQQKKPQLETTKLQRPSIFDEDSSSDADQNARPQLKPKSISTQGPGAMERRIARKVQEKALEEDPTVFQYDELYDEMENKREVQKQAKASEPKKPKYITKLLETAERRKLEYELRLERQVQKEREAEGEEFKDKESFVTSAYRKKLEEMRQMEEKDKRDEYLEAIGDVTKQKDLDGFYRHLYEQKLGGSKNVPANTAANDDEEIKNKSIKSGKLAQQRAYRKRHSSDDDDDVAKPSADCAEVKKVHLQNNIDADSDFSIDSSSSSSEDEDTKVKPQDKKENRAEKITEHGKSTQDESKTDTPDNTISNLSIDVSNKKVENLKGEPEESSEDKPKPKIDIWKKRTVGEVFDAAVQRYFERKAARNA